MEEKKTHVYFPDTDLQTMDDVPAYIYKICFECGDDQEFVEKALKSIFETMEKKGWITWTKK